jgi:uncharacterized protein YndB with AHSA1/START domain
MVSIRQIFHIDSTREKIFELISTVEGIKKWWTVNTEGSGEENETLKMRFQDNQGMDFLVEKVTASESLEWKCTWGQHEWIGTKVTFTLTEEGGKVRVNFDHIGWAEASDFYASCNFSWAKYFISLRDYCEKGQGSPFT